MTAHKKRPLHRHLIPGLATAALLAAVPWRPGMAAPAANDSPQAPVARLDNALITAMKAGGRTTFDQRYRMLDPVVAQVFDLQTVLAKSVGLKYATMPQDQKAHLAAAFRHYTVSSYVSNFGSYNGQSFEIMPNVRRFGSNQVVVSTRLLRRNESPVALDYVLAREPTGWQIVDVLTDGSISRVAVQRADFVHVLMSGGEPALQVALDRKVANLSGGMQG